MPAIDILLATWNGARFVDQLVESLAQQELQPAHIVVADDASTDATVQKLREVAGRRELPLRILTTTGAGGAASNFARLLADAAEMSSATYFAFADQDDTWHPGKLRRGADALAAAETGGPLAVFHDARVVDSAGEVLHASHLAHRGLPAAVPDVPRLLMQNPASGNTLMFNRALLDEIVPMPNEVPMHDWWTALVAASRGQLLFLDEQLVDYRQHETNERGASGTGIVRILHEARRALSAFDRDRVADRFDLAAGFAAANPDDESHPAHQLLRIRSLPPGKRQLALIEGGFLHSGLARNLAMLAYI